MHGADLVSSILNAGLSAAVLVGLLSRARVPAARFFTAYVTYGLVMRVCTWAAPGVFYTFGAWVVTDALHIALRIGVACELLWSCYGRLPGGARAARVLLVAIVALALLAACLPPDAAPLEAGPYYPLWLRLTQAGYAIGLGFVAVLVLAVRHGLPLDPLHRAIAAGMTVFCVLQALRPLVASLDAWLPLGRSAAMKIGYPLILLVWARAAWRLDEGTALSPEALRLLQPWRRPA